MFAAKYFYKRVESYLQQMEGSRLIIPFMHTSTDILLTLRSRKFEYVWVNDADPAVASLWRTILVHPRKFTSKISKYMPNQYDVAYFSAELSSLKRIPSDVEELTDTALKKLIIMQDGDIWNPQTLLRYVRSANALLKKQACRFTSWDFETVLNDRTLDDLTYIELPPSLDKADVWRLSDCLYPCKNWIVVSQDNEHARTFFRWANVEYGKDQLIIRPYID